MMTTTEVFQEKLAALRPRFIAAMRERLAELNAARSTLETAANPIEALDAIRFMAHKTAGVAANFGYQDLGAIASETEAALERALNRAAGRPHTSLIAQIDRYVDAMSSIA